MNDPSSGVPPQLLPHIHLVSTYRYPTLAQVSLDTIVEYLLQAPKITREVAAMNWMFLDAPPDGTVMLTWQPSAGIRFASDGYVWIDPEQYFSQETRGYNVEMYIHKSGHHPPHEPATTHCRRRYRLTPSPNVNLNLPPCDPSLWIVHYARAEPQSQIPVNRIPVSPQISTIMNQRRFLQQHGQLVRKEFMLHDRNNWPTINFPTVHNPPQYTQQMNAYPGNVISHMSRNQQQAYMPSRAGQHGIGPSPAKRQRQSQSQRLGPNIAAAAMAHDTSIDDEEDTSKGDLMDYLTPRDISVQRYIQHHEWMDELLSSPYTIEQIIPVELGLGRKGELESLTHSFFDAPTLDTFAEKTNDEASDSTKSASGRLAEFIKRANDKIAEINSDMEKMKKLHAKRMAILSQADVLRNAEKRLRSAVVNPLDNGTEIWRLEGATHTPLNDVKTAIKRQQEKAEDVSREVEAAMNRRIEVVHDFVCIDEGGLEVKAAPEILPADSNVMDTSADVHEQFVTDPLDSASLTPYQGFGENEEWIQEDLDQQPTGLTPGADLTPGAISQADGAISVTTPAPLQAANNQAGDSSDWVMVDKQNGSEFAAGTEHLDDIGNIGVDNTDLSKLGTDLADFEADVPGISAEGFDGADFGGTVDFDNLDTAGDALAGYGDDNDSLRNDDDIGLVLEDSAFGDAFHHTGTPTAEHESGDPPV